MQRCKAYILHYRPYSDTSIIFHTVCSDGESRSFLAKGARTRKRDKLSHIKSPMALAELVYYPSKTGDLHLLKEAQMLNVGLLQATNPLQLCLRIFTADFLYHLIKQQPAESEAYELAKFSDNWLQEAANMVEFPLHLVLLAIHHMGLSFEQVGHTDRSLSELIQRFYPFIGHKKAPVLLSNSTDRSRILQALLSYLSHTLP